NMSVSCNTTPVIGTHYKLLSPSLTNVPSNGIAVYPNPTKGIVHLKWNNIYNTRQELNISICDVVGKELLKTTLVSIDGTATLPLENIPPGIYVLHCSIGSNLVQTSKLFIGN
ncbi:MAG: T9SS type A sorting domain-containing protein, partial [Chitinophagaceae bacterium]